MKNINKMALSLVMVGLLTAAVVLASVWAYSRVLASSQLRISAYELLDLAQQVLLALVDAETSQRGYVLSGDQTYLEPYLLVRAQLGGMQSRLLAETKEPEARELLTKLTLLASAKMVAIASIVDYFAVHGDTRGLILPAGPPPKALMDSFRALHAEYVALQRLALLEIDRGVLAAMGSLLVAIVVSCLLMLFFALLVAYFLHLENGRRLHLSASLETRRLLDVQEAANTALYRTNQELQVSEERLRVTLNSIGDAVLTTDAQGRITMLNPLAESLTGWTREEAEGQPVNAVFRIINQETRLPSKVPVMETLDSGTITGLANHTLVISRTGGERAIADSCSPILDRSGVVLGAVLVFRDVTDEYAVQKATARTHEELQLVTIELERAAGAKTDFLANMSHELRTPLNSINGFSEVLYDETFGPLNEKQKKYVSNVLTSGEHLLLLINQILDMSKVESGKMTLDTALVPLRSLLLEIVDLVGGMAAKKRLSMELEIEERLPDIVADELKVREILYNLLSNVVKFTPPGGRVGIRARSLVSFVEIEVWDNGIGIAPENLKKVFEGFFRVETLHSQATEGTGLGLPLSKKLVELHGGTLMVESEGLNRGTTVRFTLPTGGER